MTTDRYCDTCRAFFSGREAIVHMGGRCHATDDAYFDRLAMWEENEAANREAEWARPGWTERG